MANIIRIKRSTGSAAPSSLANAELAYAEGSGALYIGVGTGGSNGTATTTPQIAGANLFASQTAAYVYAAPVSSNGSPSFRSLVVSDVSGLSAALDGKASLAGGTTFTGAVTFGSTATFNGSVALGGAATAATPTTSDNSTTVATTAYVKSQGYVTSSGVTSVGLSLPGIFTVSNSPVTTTGTLTGTLATQDAKKVFIGPESGAAAAPTFRALAGTDLPSSGLRSMTFDLGQTITLGNANDDNSVLFSIYGSSFSVTDQGNVVAKNVTCESFTCSTDGFTVGSAASFTSNATVDGDLTVGGNLTVQGSTVTMNTETVNVEDKNMVLGNVATPTTTTGDGGGITVRTAATSAGDKTLTWVNSTNSWTSNVGFDIASGTTYKVGGTQISAANLSNGTTGTNAVVLANGPTLTGTPLAPTAAADTNTTQIATTAYVIGQASSNTPSANAATPLAGTSLKYARADHVHPTDSSRAPLASPTFTGVPAAPTAAADTNTTQIATTAYVIGQGYLKSTTASSTYQPLDAELSAIAGLTSAADRLPYFDGSGTAALATFTTFGRSLVDDADNTAARTTLGLGTMATQNANNVAITGGSIDGITLDGGSW